MHPAGGCCTRLAPATGCSRYRRSGLRANGGAADRIGQPGAVGLIVNVRTDVQVAELFPELKRAGGAALLYKGGPLRQGLNGLLRSRTKPAGGSALFGDVYVIADPTALKKRIAAASPSESLRIYLGLCGWSAAQLRSEISRGVWRTTNPDAGVVFDPHPDTLWERLTAKLRGAGQRHALLGAPNRASAQPHCGDVRLREILEFL